MIVTLMTEHHLEFLSLKGDYRGSSESTLVKTSNCWKSHAAAHIIFVVFVISWLLYFIVNSEVNEYQKQIKVIAITSD